LLAPGHDEPDGRAEQEIEKIHVVLSGHAEVVFDTLVLQASDDEFGGLHHSLTFFSLKPVPITDAELGLISAPAG
jgi:hypothetical protein